jgi:hypothetical protein
MEEMMPNRVQRKRTKSWKMPPNTVAVDRSSGFGNPFQISKATQTHMGKTSDIWVVGTWEGPAMWFKDTKKEATELAVSAFRTWVTHPPQAALLAAARKKLRGKNLACWCSLDQPCHADVFLELVNRTDAA